MIGVTVQNLAIFLSMKYTSPVNASIINANMPIGGILLSYLIMRTPIYRVQLLGAAVSAIGVLLVITKGNILSLNFNSGDILMIVALFSGCLYTILSKRWLSNVPITQQMRWVMGCGFLQMLAIVSLNNNSLRELSLLTERDIVMITYMGLCGTLLAYTFWINGSITLGPVKVTSAFNLLPIFALLISYFSGEEITYIQVLGVILVGIGIVAGNGLIGKLSKRQSKIRSYS